MTIQQIAQQIIEYFTVWVAFMLLSSLFIIVQTVRFLKRMNELYKDYHNSSFGKRTT